MDKKECLRLIVRIANYLDDNEMNKESTVADNIMIKIAIAPEPIFTSKIPNLATAKIEMQNLFDNYNQAAKTIPPDKIRMANAVDQLRMLFKTFPPLKSKEVIESIVSSNSNEMGILKTFVTALGLPTITQSISALGGGVIGTATVGALAGAAGATGYGLGYLINKYWLGDVIQNLVDKSLQVSVYEAQNIDPKIIKKWEDKYGGKTQAQKAMTIALAKNRLIIQLRQRTPPVLLDDAKKIADEQFGNFQVKPVVKIPIKKDLFQGTEFDTN